MIWYDWWSRFPNCFDYLHEIVGRIMGSTLLIRIILLRHFVVVVEVRTAVRWNKKGEFLLWLFLLYWAIVLAFYCGSIWVRKARKRMTKLHFPHFLHNSVLGVPRASPLSVFPQETVSLKSLSSCLIAWCTIINGCIRAEPSHAELGTTGFGLNT